MMHEEGEKLFSKNVNVLLKDYDKKPISLNISIYNTRATAPGHKRELYIRLTNADDLLFLQTLTLSEDDFQYLKQQQGLLVDYAAFPQKFIDLLELCIKDQCSSSPRFILHLSTGSLTTSNGVLEVVETNPFKHLVHLSLKFVPGNDEEVKHYLAACLKSIKEEKEAMHKQQLETEKALTNRLSTAEISLKESIEEIELLKIQWRDKLTEVREKYENEIKKEKDNNSHLCKTYENRLREENRSGTERYNVVVGDLETKLNATLASNKALTEQKYKYESLIRDLKSQLISLEEERQLKTKDVDKLRLQNHHLDSDRHERDKILNHLKTRVAVLEQEVKNKDHVIKQTNLLLENATDVKNRLEVELEKKNNQIAVLETSVNSVSSEVMKGNEIIQKLQMEIKALKSRIKMMGMVTTKQEKLIDEKDISIDHLNKEKLSNQDIIAKLQEKMSQLNRTVEESSLKLTESQETLKNNENVINWLNKKLNEHTMSQLSQNTSARNGNIIGSSNGRLPLTDRTSNVINTASTNILPQRRPSPLNPINHGNNPHINKDNATNNGLRNMRPRSMGQMPYDGHMFGKPRYQSENISPILSQPRNPLRDVARSPLREIQQNSTPLSREGEEPIIDVKYLMRARTENKAEVETPKCVTGRNDENDVMDILDEPKTSTSNSAKPYIIPSSYFPSK